MGESLCNCWKFFLQSQPVPRPDSSRAGSFNNANRSVTVELHLKDPLRRIKRLFWQSAPPTAIQISGRLLPAWVPATGVRSRKGKNRSQAQNSAGRVTTERQNAPQMGSTGLDNRQDSGNPGTGSLAADVQPIATSDCHWPDRVFG